MSKEAMGENGAILGSSAYWKHLNESTIFGSLMRDTSSRAYYDTLRSAGERANDAVSEVYEDLQDNLSLIAGVSSDKRSTLAKRIDALYDVCNMSGVTCRRRDDCIGILELSSRYVPSPDREVENALQMLERDFSFTTYEAVSLLEEAVTWGFDRATWRDERKINFLLKLMQGNREDFLKTVLDAYNNRSGKVEARGKCGYELGSSEYLRHLEKQVFLQELPSRSGENYAKLLRESLGSIAKQLERDLSVAERENSYITDPTAIVLRSAASELDRCNISPRISDDSIDRLAWFVGGNAEKIRQLQRKLNEVSFGAHLTEDGVYGKKTEDALANFVARVKNDLQSFLLDKEAVARAGFIASLGLELSSAWYNVRSPQGILPQSPGELLNDLAHFLVDNRKNIQRLIWKRGAEKILRAKGLDAAAFMLEHSLEKNPCDLYCGQTHWITQKILQSNGFQNAFSTLKKNLLQSLHTFIPVGSFGVNFQETGDQDLYLSIGKCDLKYVVFLNTSPIRIDFLIDDPYDFNEIRSFGVEDDVAFFNKELGALANDGALFSQGDRVITTYETHIRFSKILS